MILQPVTGYRSGGASALLLPFGAGNVGTTPSSRYLFPGSSDELAKAVEIGFSCPRTGTLRQLRVKQNLPEGNGAIINYILRVAGGDTAMQVALASTSSVGVDSINAVPVNEGDAISIKVDKASDVLNSPRSISATIELE